MTDHIDHSAVVVSVDPSSNTVKLRVNDASECGSCPASNLCRGNGEPSNLITVVTPHASTYRPDDIVTVRGTEQMHHRAIMYATVLPCIALVAVMVGVYLLTFNQLMAALCGLGTTVLFFIILWAMRNKIAHEFHFEIIGKPERAGNYR